jgi:WD40 repeat protein
VKLWQVASGNELCTFKGHTSGILSLAFSPNGRRLASASDDNTVKVWDAVGSQEPRTLKGHTSRVTSVAFSPDGTELASAGRDQMVKLWDAASGQELQTLLGHAAPVTCVSFSPNANCLASAGQDNTIQLWNTATGQELHTLRGHSGGVWCVTFSPNGRWLATASFDKTVKVWDTSNGQLQCTLLGHTDPVWRVVFSPDGARLASASGLPVAWTNVPRPGEIKLWDFAAGREMQSLREHTHAIASIAFSPDGAQLATTQRDGVMKVWDASSGHELRRLSGKGWFIAFEPHGARLASASFDGTVKFWDAATDLPLCTLKAHNGEVPCVAFSPDGLRLASAGHDGTVKLWDARPLTLELRAEREAMGLLEFLVNKGRSKTQVTQDLLADRTISETVRQKALSLVEVYEKGGVQQQASLLAGSLFAQPMVKREMIEAVHNNPGLSEQVRRTASKLAENWRGNANLLNNASWSIAAWPGREEAAYHHALLLAKEACRLAPEDANLLNTLGVALYRTGKYELAIDTLEHCDNLRNNQSEPADLAFLAMAHLRLPHKEKAQVYLKRIRALMKKSEWAYKDEEQSFLREVEDVLQDDEKQTK